MIPAGEGSPVTNGSPITTSAETNKFRIANSSALVAVLAMLSPVAGLALEVIIAWRFGSSTPVDAYRASYLLINFGALLAAVVLPHLIIPAVVRLRSEDRELDGWRVAFTAGYGLTAPGLLLLLYSALAPSSLLHLLAPGLTTVPTAAARQLLVACSLALLSALCCGALAGLLQIYNSFVIPSLAQTIFNLSFCVVVAVIGTPESFSSIAAGITLGASLMLIFHVLGVIRVAAQRRIPMAKALLPTLDLARLKFLTNAYPLFFLMFSSIFATVILTRGLSRGGPGILAQFGYALKLLVITSIGPNALATVIFPSLATAYAAGNLKEFHQLISRAMKMTFLLLTPITVILYIFRLEITDLLFNRGSMQAAAIVEISFFFGILLLQVIPSNFTTFLQKLSFAMGDAKAPALFAAASAIFLAVLVSPAFRHYGGIGVLYAFTVVQSVIPLLFVSYQIVRFRVIAWKELLPFFLLVSVLSGATGGLSLLVRTWFRIHYDHGRPALLIELMIGMTASALFVAAASRLLKISEVRELETAAVGWMRRLLPAN